MFFVVFFVVFFVGLRSFCCVFWGFMFMFVGGGGGHGFHKIESIFGFGFEDIFRCYLLEFYNLFLIFVV